MLTDTNTSSHSRLQHPAPRALLPFSRAFPQPGTPLTAPVATVAPAVPRQLLYGSLGCGFSCGTLPSHYLSSQLTTEYLPHTLHLGTFRWTWHMVFQSL